MAFNKSEQEVADTLDALKVAWVYEPTLFVLKEDEAGNPKEGFRPDFYLPKLDIYIEVTMGKQSNVTGKNRKARLANEIHGARVWIIYGRDFKRLKERILEVLQEAHDQNVGALAASQGSAQAPESESQ